MKDRHMILTVCLILTWSVGGCHDSLVEVSEHSPVKVDQSVLGKTRDPLTGKIIFETNRDGNYEIYLMNPDGSELVNLTRDPENNDHAASWSPNGQQIVFAKYPQNEIWVMNRDGSEQTRLTDNNIEEGQPVWSADGKIAFYRIEADGYIEIYVMNADGSDPVNVTNHPSGDAHPDWSPNGRKIAFVSNRGGNYDVWVMDRDGSNLVQVTNDPAEEYNPAWSPNGQEIAFRRTSGGDDIFIMNADGTDVRQLTSNAGEDALPDWSPTGKYITFAVEREDIYRIKVDGSGQTNITNDLANNWRPRWGKH